MGSFWTRLYEADSKHKPQLLILSPGLLSFLQSSAEIDFAAKLLAEVITKVQELPRRRGETSSFDPDECAAALTQKSVPARFAEILQGFLMERRPDRAARPSYSSRKQDLQGLGAKQNLDSYNPSSREKTLRQDQENRRPTSSKSKQFKKIDYQTYEYISRDVLPAKIEEVSEHNSSLGKDTHKDLLNWEMSKGSSCEEPIGVTLKNLITQNTQSTAIQLSRAQPSSRSPYKQSISPSPLVNQSGVSSSQYSTQLGSKAKITFLKRTADENDPAQANKPTVLQRARAPGQLESSRALRTLHQPTLDEDSLYQPDRKPRTGRGTHQLLDYQSLLQSEEPSIRIEVTELPKKQTYRADQFKKVEKKLNFGDHY